VLLHGAVDGAGGKAESQTNLFQGKHRAPFAAGQDAGFLRGQRHDWQGMWVCRGKRGGKAAPKLTYLAILPTICPGKPRSDDCQLPACGICAMSQPRILFLAWHLCPTEFRSHRDELGGANDSAPRPRRWRTARRPHRARLGGANDSALRPRGCLQSCAPPTQGRWGVSRCGKARRSLQRGQGQVQRSERHPLTPHPSLAGASGLCPCSSLPQSKDTAIVSTCRRGQAGEMPG
jgi:hypothetical protein